MRHRLLKFLEEAAFGQQLHHRLSLSFHGPARRPPVKQLGGERKHRHGGKERRGERRLPGQEGEP